jgi:hypothetical protein
VISIDQETLCSELFSSPQEGKDDNKNTVAADDDESGSSEKCCYSYYYVTTQTLPVDDEGRPAVCSWLLQALIDRQTLPLRPKILGHLIPMSCAGLWLGQTPNHHHRMRRSSMPGPVVATIVVVVAPVPVASTTTATTNCTVCLIHGRARHLRIAPPVAVRTVIMAGTFYCLHANGRIVDTEDFASPPVVVVPPSQATTATTIASYTSHRFNVVVVSVLVVVTFDPTEHWRRSNASWELEQRHADIDALLDEIDNDDHDDDDASSSTTTTKKQELLDDKMNNGVADDDETTGDDDNCNDDDGTDTKMLLSDKNRAARRSSEAVVPTTTETKPTTYNSPAMRTRTDRIDPNLLPGFLSASKIRRRT